MGTAVPLEAQEGNKYILTLIMKAIVACALAAFAANSIEATPYGYYLEGIMARSQPQPQQQPYHPYYAVHPFAKRHAPELYEPLEYDNDYYAVLAKRDTYSEEGIQRLHEERLTKREDLDTYLDAEADPL